MASKSKPATDLTADQRRFVMRHMADWDTKRQCYEAYMTEFHPLAPRKEDYDRAYSRIDYLYNHPNSKRFRAEAMELRATLIADMSDLPIFHKRYRLRYLAGLLTRAGSPTEERKILTQAQKECEGMKLDIELPFATIQKMLDEIASEE